MESGDACRLFVMLRRDCTSAFDTGFRVFLTLESTLRAFKSDFTAIFFVFRVFFTADFRVFFTFVFFDFGFYTRALATAFFFGAVEEEVGIATREFVTRVEVFKR